MMSAIIQPVTSTSAQHERQRSGWDHLKTLLPYVARYRGMVALGLLTLALMGIVGALPQLIIGAIIDCLKGSPEALSTLSGTSRAILRPILSFYAPLSRHALGLYCWMLVGAMLVKGFLSFWTRWILIGISREIEFDLRNDLMARLVKLDPGFYVRNRTGDLMSRTTNDLNAVRMVLGPGIMYSATTIITMIMAILVMVTLSPSLTLWVLLPAPVVAIAVWFFGKTIHDLYESIQAALATLTARVQENLAGVRVVRAYAQEEAEIRGFDEPNREYVSANIKLIRTWSMFMPSLQALIGITFLIVLWQGGHQLFRGQISLGALIAFNGYLTLLVWPMIALGWVTNIFQRGAASMGRLNYILIAKPNIDDRNAKVPEGTKPRGEMEFRHLTFAYPTTLSGAGSNGATTSNGSGSHPVLRNIDLKVPAGSAPAIRGPPGCRKHTLAALIARLWEAPDDSVLIDGRPIREWPLITLRQSIGFVPQDTYLFGG